MLTFGSPESCSLSGVPAGNAPPLASTSGVPSFALNVCSTVASLPL